MLTELDKEYLRLIVSRELKKFKEEESAVHDSEAIALLKGTHEYSHFLEQLLEKLKRRNRKTRKKKCTQNTWKCR